MRDHIRFLLNGDKCDWQGGCSRTLLDELRVRRRMTGTKEGCAEGDCGACTVLVGRLAADGLRYETVNACIRLMGSLDGCHVVTVEHLQAATASCTPSSRRWSSTTARNAASARQAS